MAIQHLPPDVRWFFDLSGSLFPHHIRSLWWQDQLVASNPNMTDMQAHHLFEQLVRMKPDDLAPGDVTGLLLPLRGKAPAFARYVALTSGTRQAFVFAFVSLPLAEELDPMEVRLDNLSLTRRESEIALQLAAGLSLADIGRRSACSPSTTRNLLKNAMRKTHCRSQSELVHLVLGSLHIY